jgi:glycosyltransferase involved in cell wall biosynthesis
VDIVQAEAGAGFGYAWFRPPGGAPLVLHPHGMEEFKAGRLKRSAYLPLRWAIRYAARRAEKVLIPDRTMAGEVREHLSVGEGRTVLLPNAIDLEEIDRPVPAAAREAILSRLGVDARTTLILSVGRLESNKGFSFLAEALGRCKDELPRPWLWIVVGDGPEKPRLVRAVRGLGLVETTRFAGRVSDTELAALYTAAALFAHPTLYEGSSLVTLEAMAHSLPVVATAVGGIPDKVVEGESGFLVPPGDAEALAAALIRAFRLGEGLPERGRRGRRRVESEFSWTERARRLIELYLEVLAAHGSS